MSIRLRLIAGQWIALCAARSVEKPGDVYLDDGHHYALAEKFWLDYADETGSNLPAPRPEIAALINREESNNANRAEWDITFAITAPNVERHISDDS